MERSTLHIKAPHEIHIAAKMIAARHRISMNQYVINLIEADMKNNNLPKADVVSGIELSRKASPRQKKIIYEAAKAVNEVIPGAIKNPEIIKTADDVPQLRRGNENWSGPVYRDKKKGKI